MLRHSDKTQDLELELFETSQKESLAKSKKHQARTVANRDLNDTSARRGDWRVMTLIGAVVMFAFCAFIYGDIELNQLNARSNEVLDAIEEARRINTQLLGELSSRASPARVEEFAAENGLVRVLNRDVIPFEIDIGNTVQLAYRPPLRFFERFSNGFYNALEFLGFL
ncbi:MAG: hypothetical protein FWD35_00500 [Oscillospiraceae bacterium]|nr:hypothetical protein [Oscillospiraceae bacterium]